ncbi:MAG: S-methyl-5-thioribose-1-phosphate isomerase [Tepidisphaeraceae bacterium]
MLQTLEWTGQSVRMIDQTRLPTQTVYVEIADSRQMWDAIRRLVVRGAPAIGVAAAFGAYLGVRGSAARDARALLDELTGVCDHLATSRPTAVNLFWALRRMRRAAEQAATRDSDVEAIKRRLLDEAVAMLDEDVAACRRIGEHGATLLEDIARGKSTPSKPFGVLTHCNAGVLAAVRYGTALSPLYVAVERGMRLRVWADETRPLLQGSRITAWELKAGGVPVTVICDSMAASVMALGQVDAVIVGADRIAANGDVANKIGTLGVAILARHFDLPFLVAAPTSTLDPDTPTGSAIPIEQRDPSEITHGLGKQTTPDGVDVFNPAFDVTPNDLVTAIITETGILKPPFRESIRTALGALA